MLNVFRAFKHVFQKQIRRNALRLDKYLKISRILKRRTVASAACQGGRVSVNGKPAKPAHQLKEGDVVEVSFGSGGKFAFKVLSLKEYAKKDEAEEMYEIINNE
jgi:ribosomal 50S subunit-recycling heat shock protein